jgi:lysophospholipase L1-like esterase
MITIFVLGRLRKPTSACTFKWLQLLAVWLAVVSGSGGITRGGAIPAVASPTNYLLSVSCEMAQCWPTNHSVNIVCHGHSVPAGYARTPEVRTFDAYPYLLHRGLSERFPHAVINVIVTAIGGENSEQGAARFGRDVLSLKPEVVTIDYALNDRHIGVAHAEKAWRAMIEAAQQKNVKVILLTPTGDLSAKLADPNDPLNRQAELIRRLAAEYHVGLVDSLAAFQNYVHGVGKLSDLMAQVNHPNRHGHELVAAELLKWFPAAQ